MATPSDTDHDAAKSFLASTNEPLLTSDYVVDELLTLFTVRGQKAKGIEWLHDVLAGGGTQLAKVQDEDFERALQVYERFRDKSWSFTDCSSYVLMERLGINRAFSFDGDFRQFGSVTVLPTT
jgi:predicted nucleic acid-binding protein